MKAARTFVLLANEHEARFLVNEGPGKGLLQVGGLTQTHETQYSDMPGRSQAGPGAARHGLDRSATEREQNRTKFSVEVAEAAEAQWAKGDYDRVVMAAPPKMLGALREDIGGAMKAAMAGDMDKDLLKVALHDLPPHLEDMIVF